MWTREELKTRAKINLKKYYWAAFAVSLIFSVISGFGGGNSGGSIDSDNTSGYENFGAAVIGQDEIGNYIHYNVDDLPGALQQTPDFINRIPISSGRSGGNIAGLLTGAFLGVAIVFLILGAVLSIFVIPVMEVGKNRFYMESRGLGTSAGVGKLFWGFSNQYLNIVLTIFLRNLFIGLGYILCVIPGIYLHYCYYMVPYILSENPEMKPMEAMSLSKEMMDGHKFNTWVLELSFIGWILLGVLACCIGTWFVQPYYDATFAELYAVLRRPYGGRLSGFGVPDVVPAGGGFGTYVNPDNVYDAGGYNAGGQYNQGQPGGYNAGDQYGQSQGGHNAGGQYGQSQDGGYNTGGYDAGGQYGQSQTGVNGDGSQPADGAEGFVNNLDVSRSEGGPGKGYYLNGEFHPYTDDEK